AGAALTDQAVPSHTAPSGTSAPRLLITLPTATHAVGALHATPESASVCLVGLGELTMDQGDAAACASATEPNNTTAVKVAPRDAIRLLAVTAHLISLTSTIPFLQ